MWFQNIKRLLKDTVSANFTPQEKKKLFKKFTSQDKANNDAVYWVKNITKTQKYYILKG